VSQAAVNGSQMGPQRGSQGAGACLFCGQTIVGKQGRLYCKDRCRLLAWARRQQGVLPGFLAPPAAAKAKRLAGNALRALARLRQGPATNVELLALAGMRFGARLFELRRAGYHIETDEDKRRGVVTYTLRVNATT